MINARKLTEEETNTLKKKARDILSVCRRDILSKYPFIGSIALRMDMVPVRDWHVRTACTDGNSVYFDIAFLSSLTREQQQFVLAHEIWHAVMLHLVRRHNRDPQLFNIATDKEVNYMLKQDGFTAPNNLCFPEGEEVGKCAEEIYEMLLKKMKKQQKQNGKSGNQQQSGAGGSGKSQPSGGSGSSKNGQPNKNQKNKGNGNEDGSLTGQFDKHVYEGEEDGKNGNSNGNQQDGNSGDGSSCKMTDKYGEVGDDPDYQPMVSKHFADKMRETIIAEAQRIAKLKGNLPAHIKALVDKIVEPEVKWQEILARFVTRCYNSGNRSWIPPNRRHVHNDVYLQSRQASKIRLACIIDTSGSTFNDRGKFLAELNSLIKSFGIFDLWLIEIDAEIGAIKHYTQDDNLEQEIENGEYAMTGGGGTALLDGFKAIVEQQMEVDAVLALTDGYIDHIPTNPTGLPTLWIITKDGTEDFCDWGEKIRLKFNDSDGE